ncbi:hypothetical protein [Croceicoccus sp. YJ47]|uniref:hypothetical protein n=1 Tax=Croceicoccus sp. YJ47 TaxID=2798724 RepID=UPI001923BE6A|nr:hypothetical protein [Croceicoccus sp. YJ47]QQN73907.1 hypothetical protein JD971_14350 [Croceicoccus sp. YJ47]
MQDNASEAHNELVPELLQRIIRGTETEEHAFVVLESLTLGMMLYFRPNPKHAAEYLDVMTQAIIERMATR